MSSLLTMELSTFFSNEKISRIIRLWVLNIKDSTSSGQYKSIYIYNSIKLDIVPISEGTWSLLIDKPILNNKYFAAIDWAKSHDYTVITILNSLKQVVFRYKMTGLDYTKQGWKDYINTQWVETFDNYKWRK